MRVRTCFTKIRPVLPVDVAILSDYAGRGSSVDSVARWEKKRPECCEGGQDDAKFCSQRCTRRVSAGRAGEHRRGTCRQNTGCACSDVTNQADAGAPQKPFCCDKSTLGNAARSSTPWALTACPAELVEVLDLWRPVLQRSRSRSPGRVLAGGPPRPLGSSRALRIRPEAVQAVRECYRHHSRHLAPGRAFVAGTGSEISLRVAAHLISSA